MVTMRMTEIKTTFYFDFISEIIFQHSFQRKIDSTGVF